MSGLYQRRNTIDLDFEDRAFFLHYELVRHNRLNMSPVHRKHHKIWFARHRMGHYAECHDRSIILQQFCADLGSIVRHVSNSSYDTSYNPAALTLKEFAKKVGYHFTLYFIYFHYK
jgi:hypothetical protein